MNPVEHPTRTVDRPAIGYRIIRGLPLLSRLASTPSGRRYSEVKLRRTTWTIVRLFRDVVGLGIDKRAYHDQLQDRRQAGSYQSRPCLRTTSRVAPFCPWRSFPDMDARQCQPSTEGETTMAQRRQRGWLKKESRSHGDTWALFFRKSRKTDGKHVENKVPIGLVKNLPPTRVCSGRRSIAKGKRP